MKTGIVIQARSGSSRLPDKVLLPFGEKTVLETVVERTIAAECGDPVIATTTSPPDDRIAALADRMKIPCVRGPETDVLARYLLAVREQGLDIVVRITADCPFIWPGEISRAVDHLQAGSLDYATNAGCIKGLSAEAVTAAALEKADQEATDPYDREHVTPWLSRAANGNGDFPPTGPSDRDDLRLTLDTPADYGFLCALRASAEASENAASPDWLATTIDQSPWWTAWQRQVVTATLTRP